LGDPGEKTSRPLGSRPLRSCPGGHRESRAAAVERGALRLQELLPTQRRGAGAASSDGEMLNMGWDMVPSGKR